MLQEANQQVLLVRQGFVGMAFYVLGILWLNYAWPGWLAWCVTRVEDVRWFEERATGRFPISAEHAELPRGSQLSRLSRERLPRRSGETNAV